MADNIQLHDTWRSKDKFWFCCLALTIHISTSLIQHSPRKSMKIHELPVVFQLLHWTTGLLKYNTQLTEIVRFQMYLKSSFGFPIPRKGQLSCDCTLLFPWRCLSGYQILCVSRPGRIPFDGAPSIIMVASSWSPMCSLGHGVSFRRNDLNYHAECVLLRINIEMVMIWNADFFKTLYLITYYFIGKVGRNWKAPARLMAGDITPILEKLVPSVCFEATRLDISLLDGQVLKQRRFCHVVVWRLLIAV